MSATHTVRERRVAELGVLLTVLIWSANFVVVKGSIGSFGPMSFTALRYVIATITLFALIRWRMGGIPRPEGLWLRLIALGVVGFGAYQVTWTFGLTMITAGDSALIVAAAPVLTALLAGAIGLDRITAPKMAGALVAFTGVAVVITAGHELSLGASLLGDALTLTAAVLWAVYTVLGSRMLRHTDPLQATAWSVLGGMLFLLPFAAFEILTTPAHTFTSAAILGVIYSGTLAAGTANVLVFNAVRIVGPARASAAQFLVPFGAVILGAIFLAEPVGIPQLVGGAIIVMGVALTRRASILPEALRARLPWPE